MMEKEDEIASMQRQLEDLKLIYQYLTGPHFRQQIEAIVEKFSNMQADIERERKTMMRLRAKREGQIRGVIKSTVGMYGDLQGVAGKALEEIDGLTQIARQVRSTKEAQRHKPSTGGANSQIAAALIDEGLHASIRSAMDYSRPQETPC